MCFMRVLSMIINVRSFYSNTYIKSTLFYHGRKIRLEIKNHADYLKRHYSFEENCFKSSIYEIYLKNDLYKMHFISIKS